MQECRFRAIEFIDKLFHNCSGVSSSLDCFFKAADGDETTTSRAASIIVCDEVEWKFVRSIQNLVIDSICTDYTGVAWLWEDPYPHLTVIAGNEESHGTATLSPYCKVFPRVAVRNEIYRAGSKRKPGDYVAVWYEQPGRRKERHFARYA